MGRFCHKFDGVRLRLLGGQGANRFNGHNDSFLFDRRLKNWIPRPLSDRFGPGSGFGPARRLHGTFDTCPAIGYNGLSPEEEARQ